MNRESPFKDFFDNEQKGLIITDFSGIIKKVNPKACLLLKEKEANLIEKHLWILLTPIIKNFIVEKVAQTNKKDLVLWSLDDKIEKEEENEVGTFLAAMTHEIRTPMNGIIGMADLASEEEMSAPLKEYISMIKLSANSLLRVINDILDYSKYEAGKLQIETIPIHFDSFMNDLVQLFSAQAEVKGLKLSYIKDKRIPHTLFSDPIRIKQILQNLFSNAIKFTSQGSITITTKLDTKICPSRVHFSVKDTGIGIPKEKQYLLFKSFTQVDKSTTRKYGGTGLGLAMCANLCSLLDGGISVESDEKKGSTFDFYIPLQVQSKTQDLKPEKICFDLKDNEPQLLEKTLSFSKDSFSKKSVLIIDDNKVNQLLACRILEKKKISSYIAENGIEGFEAFKKNRPSLIFMDIQMPIMDGYESTKKIRFFEKENDLPPIPIIALTATIPQDLEQKNNQFTDYLSKPFLPKDIEKILKLYLN